MKTIQDAEKALNELKQQADELQKFIEQEKKKAEPDFSGGFKEGFRYYWVQSNGYIIEYAFKYLKEEISQGNVFHTREEAEKELDKRKVLWKLKCLAKGYKFENGELNFRIVRHADFGKFSVEGNRNLVSQGVVYFATREDAQNAIDILGDELNILFE